MQIRDITLDDVRAGKNWRIIEFDPDIPYEDQTIEPLGEFQDEDQIVYSALSVYLKDHGEPRTGFWDRIKGRGRKIRDCRYAPREPKELAGCDIPIVEPLLMVLTLNSGGGDYCEMHGGQWRQLGLVPNPDAPLTTEYVANPLLEDTEFQATYDDRISREVHMERFRKWLSYLPK